MKIKKDYIPELREIGRLAFEREVTLWGTLAAGKEGWMGAVWCEGDCPLWP